MARWSPTARHALWLLCWAGASLAPVHVVAAIEELRPNRVAIEYVQPQNPGHQAIYATLRERRVLEHFRAYLSPLRLPRTLRLRTAGCDGEANAWYDEDNEQVTVCYEYFAEALSNAPARTTAAGVTPQDAVLGPGVEVFLHEVAHALFHLLRVPILGREEDAADQVADYLILHLDDDMKRRVVASVARMYDREAKAKAPERDDMADVHGLSAQRLYNLLCLAYGADSKLFGDVLNDGHLPAERAEGCVFEYQQVAYAVHRLIEPYVDRAVKDRVQPRRHMRALKAPARDH